MFRVRIAALVMAMSLPLTGCGNKDVEAINEQIETISSDIEEIAEESPEDISEEEEDKEAITAGDDLGSNEYEEDIDRADAEEIDIEETDTEDKPAEQITETEAENTNEGILSSTEDINLRDTDGAGTNYLFTYDGEDFSAIYTPDNWKIRNSYRIENVADMVIICQALIDEHPIHGSDMVSFRDAEDMAYEWLQHDMAYEFLSDDNAFKEKARDVDLDPEDQNKDFEEIYEDRTGKEFDISDFLN